MSIDFSGTWNADLSNSTFIGPKPAAMQMTIDHRDPELRQEVAVTKEDGSQDRAVFLCRATGEADKTFLNGHPFRGVAKWAGDELVIESWMKLCSGEVYFCDCWSLSFDRETLIMEHRNDALTGQRVVLVRAS